MVDLNSRIHHNGKPPYKHTNLNTQNTVFDSFKTYIGLNQLGSHSKTIKYFLSFGCIYVDWFDVGGGLCWIRLMLVTKCIYWWLILHVEITLTHSATNFLKLTPSLKSPISYCHHIIVGYGQCPFKRLESQTLHLGYEKSESLDTIKYLNFQFFKIFSFQLVLIK